MKKTIQKNDLVNDYIASALKEAQPALKKIRAEIKRRLPDAIESFSYKMPAYRGEKFFFYFAAFKKHIGVYPPVRNKQLQKKLKSYMNEKGNLAFPLNEEIPIKLIGDVAVSLWKQINKIGQN